MTQSTSEPSDDAPPIFVVGSPRSGTTLTRLILDAHPHISCGSETHFLINLSQLDRQHWSRIASYGVDHEDWDDRMRALFESVHVPYMRSRGRRRWADKTPQYALHLDYIDRLFPTALYIHVIRDGRDVVASHRDRSGYKGAVKGLPMWIRSVDAARAFGRGPGSSRYFELRYEPLVTAPEETLRPMFEFLGEPWDPRVLEFDQKSERAASRRDEAGDASLIYTSRVGTGGKTLDPALRSLVNVRGRRLLKELGYES